MPPSVIQQRKKKIKCVFLTTNDLLLINTANSVTTLFVPLIFSAVQGQLHRPVGVCVCVCMCLFGGAFEGCSPGQYSTSWWTYGWTDPTSHRRRATGLDGRLTDRRWKLRGDGRHGYAAETQEEEKSNVYFKLRLLSVDSHSNAFSESVWTKLPQQRQ